VLSKKIFTEENIFASVSVAYSRPVTLYHEEEDTFSSCYSDATVHRERSARREMETAGWMSLLRWIRGCRAGTRYETITSRNGRDLLSFSSNLRSPFSIPTSSPSRDKGLGGVECVSSRFTKHVARRERNDDSGTTFVIFITSQKKQINWKMLFLL